MKHLWLDLEDTVIEPVLNGWFNTQLIPTGIAKVKKIINEFQPDRVHVFSFAVWNEQELTRFNMGTRPRLEAALGVTFSSVPTVDDDMIPAACKFMGLSPDRVDFEEMSNFWGKQQTFRLNLLHIYRHRARDAEATPIEAMLVDDVVYNETFEIPQLNLKGHVLNILEYTL